MGIYEQILSEDNTDAEVYWSLVLCRYGIEYVEDPATHKRIPTINRAQFTAVLADEDYKSALRYADPNQREIYEAEARTIDEIQKGILAISQKEEPFDVFICYKETDQNGRRTPDSVLATELYHELVREGFKVFFSRITLEDKLGVAYEPYIFAALNSAKVMVVLGTKAENFNAVWVKNEWSRYLALIKQGKKKMLIPAYRDMDPYDLPEEFSHLQAQDMAKLGFMQDLVRGITKIVGTKGAKSASVSAPTQQSVPAQGDTSPLLKRANLFLEDNDWNSAYEYSEKVLDINPECAEAYLIKLLIDLKLTNRRQLGELKATFTGNPNYAKIIRFADDTLATEMKGYEEAIRVRATETQYLTIRGEMMRANSESEFKNVAEKFKELSEYKDSAQLEQECLEKAEAYRKDHIYGNAVAAMNLSRIKDLERAANLFSLIPGWRDADNLWEDCLSEIDYQKREAERIKIEREKKAKWVKIISVIAVSVILWGIIIAVVVSIATAPARKYVTACNMMLSEDYAGAIELFVEIGDYKDSKEKLERCEDILKRHDYDMAITFIDAHNWTEAIRILKSLGNYKDCKDLLEYCEQMKSGNYIPVGESEAVTRSSAE